jgi:hypothetical protein
MEYGRTPAVEDLAKSPALLFFSVQLSSPFRASYELMQNPWLRFYITGDTDQADSYKKQIPSRK